MLFLNSNGTLLPGKRQIGNVFLHTVYWKWTSPTDFWRAEIKWGSRSSVPERSQQIETSFRYKITWRATHSVIVHLVFTWACRQVSKTIRKAKTEANANWKITGAISHTFQMDMNDFILRREVLPLVSFRFPVHPYPYIYSINFVLIMSMKYVNYTVVASGIMYASWLNIPASFFKKYARFW